MFGIRVRKSSAAGLSNIVIEPTTKSEREWYEMTRDGQLYFIVHKAYL